MIALILFNSIWPKIMSVHKNITLLFFFFSISCSDRIDKTEDSPTDTDITDTDVLDTADIDEDDTGNQEETPDQIEAARERATTTCTSGGLVSTNSGISGSYCFAPLVIGSQFETSSSSYTLQVGSTLVVSP